MALITYCSFALYLLNNKERDGDDVASILYGVYGGLMGTYGSRRSFRYFVRHLISNETMAYMSACCHAFRKRIPAFPHVSTVFIYPPRRLEKGYIDQKFGFINAFFPGLRGLQASERGEFNGCLNPQVLLWKSDSRGNILLNDERFLMKGMF